MKEYEMKRELKRLASIRGNGTELISIYVPPGFPISEEVAKLREEHGQASNIKSKTTRLNVQGAIEKIIQYLKLYKAAPKNGIAVFCGNLARGSGNEDIELFSIEPPMPIKANIYRCDSTFLLEPLQAMLESKDIYALLVMDGRDATIAELKGTRVDVEKKVRSLAHAKVRKGGQSAARYERGSEEATNDYYKNVAEAVNGLYAKNDFKVKGLIVGGPGPSKENFLKSNNLNYQVKVLGVFDTGYTDENEGIKELLDKSKEVLKEQEAIQEARIMERFLSEISRKGLATYGYENVKREFDANNIDKLIISEEVEIEEVNYTCSLCNAQFKKLEMNGSRQDKHECGGKLEVTGTKDLLAELVDLAEENGIETYFISADSQYGQELLLGFKGVAAMLKYKR
ncbi:MAG: peptide chain release factor aRF-1 [Candidatus Micrarchaeaceae archaeon]